MTREGIEQAAAGVLAVCRRGDHFAEHDKLIVLTAAVCVLLLVPEPELLVYDPPQLGELVRYSHRKVAVLRGESKEAEAARRLVATMGTLAAAALIRVAPVGRPS